MLSRHSNRKRVPLPGNSASRRGIYNHRQGPILLRFPSITRRAKVLALFVFITSGVALAGKEFNLPTPHPAPTYPARDQHSDESVTVAVDPYDMPDKAAIDRKSTRLNSSHT